MKPLVSIVIPVYNAEKTLERCVDSVLQQSFRNYEAILVDDGSQDRSGAICDRYAGADQRVHVVHQSNRGVSSARNTGMAAANGEYLFFLDSDDWLLGNTLSTYAGALDAGACDVVIGGLTVHEAGKSPRRDGVDAGQSFGPDLWEAVCRDSRPFGYAGGKMLRSSLVRDHAIQFRTDMESQEDLDFFLSVYEHCERVSILAFAGYQYDFVPGKRFPPVWDFIANQLKLLRIAQKKANLPGEAITCVHNRILSLLYTGLYTASEQGSFEDAVQRIAQLDGLHDLLKTIDAEGEQRFVARNFAAGRYDRLRHYFTLRNRIRDAFRNIRKKCKPAR